MKKGQGSDSLYHLVKKLDANERGYVKKFLKRHSEKGNVNLELVEAIEKQKEYNEVALKKKFKSLAVVKVQTWDEIMDALCIYNKNRSITFETTNTANQVGILLYKGLKTEAKKLVDASIKKSYEADDFYGLINLLSVRANITPEKDENKPASVLYDEYMVEIISAVDRLKEIYEYVRETIQLSYLHFNPHRKGYVREIETFKKNSLLFRKKPSSNYALRYYYDAHALYYASIGDKLSHIKYLKMANTLVNERMYKLQVYDEHFMYSNMTLIAAYLTAKQYTNAQRHIIFMQDFPIRNKTFKTKIDIEVQYMQLSLYNRARQIMALKSYIDKNKKSIIVHAQSHHRIYVSNQFKICYLISLLLLEKHTDASRWILECDNDKTFRTGDINYQLVLIIEIVLNYVLGDIETAQKVAKKHALKKEYSFQPLFKTLSIADKKKREQSLVETMENSKVDTRLLLEYFDVFEWLSLALKLEK